MQGRQARRASTEFLGQRGTWAFPGLWEGQGRAVPTACRVQQDSQARPASQDVLDTTGKSASLVPLDRPESLGLGGCKAIPDWRAGMVPWEAQAQVPSTELPACPVLQDPSDLLAHQARQALPEHLAVLARSAPMVRTGQWACQACRPCMDIGRISGGQGLSCLTSECDHRMGGSLVLLFIM